jgi:DNA-binding XRE family transcriptional regulator
MMTYDPEANEAMHKPDDAGAAASEAGGKERASKPKASKKSGNKPNNVRKIRIERMMSKAELARRANLSVLTIDRVEKGFGCRMDTKRKILEALGLRLADRVRVFGEEE